MAQRTIAIDRSRPPRDRLLTAAAELFYAEGIHAVGIDRICQRAGVSKRTLYQLFATKDDLVTASLAAAGPAYARLSVPDDQPSFSARQAVLAVFARLEEFAGTAGAGFLGCPFVDAATE